MPYPITILHAETRIISLPNVNLPITDIDIVDNMVHSFDVDYYVSIKVDANWSAWSRIDDMMPLLSTLSHANAGIRFKITPNINNYAIQSIAVNTVAIPYNALTQSVNNMIQASIVAIDQELFDVYGQAQNATALLRAQTKSINDMFGHVMYYVKVTSDKIDDTLKTVLNYKATQIKPIKILVVDNDFADSKLVYSEYGATFDKNVKINITIEEFEKAFGALSQPQAKDYIYMPQLGRVYTITSANNERHFMWTSTFYECTLEKYVIDSNINTDLLNTTDFDVFTEFQVDNLTTLEVDGENEPSDEIITNSYVERKEVVKQHTQFNLRTNESVRSAISTLVELVDTYVSMNGITYITKSYDLTLAKTFNAIEYQHHISDSMTYTQWFMLTDLTDNELIVIGDDPAYLFTASIVNSQLVVGQVGSLHNTATVEDNVWYMLVIKSDAINKTFTTQLFKRESEDQYVNSGNLVKLFDDSFALNTAILGKIIIRGGTYLLSNIRCYNKMLTNKEIMRQSITVAATVEYSLFIDNVYSIGQD